MDYNAYHRNDMRQRYAKRKAEAYALLGGQCSQCRSTANLEIDHKNRDEKKFDLSKLRTVTYLIFLEEIAKCQLLCKPCHIYTKPMTIWAGQDFLMVEIELMSLAVDARNVGEHMQLT